MKRWNRTNTFVALALACAGITTGWSFAVGQELRAVDGPFPRGEQAMSTMVGRVKDLLKTPRGDVDGFLLEDGSQVHFPPYVGERVVKLIAPGESVEVKGRAETLPKGERVFEASQISSRGETVSVDPPRRPAAPHHRPEGRRRPEEPMEAAGTIHEFVTNRHGDVDGFVLKDGTEIKIPPHQGVELQSAAEVGDEVLIEGRRHETPRGDIHLHADRITMKATGKVLDRDGPEVRRDNYAQILQELREIRRLLEVLPASK